MNGHRFVELVGGGPRDGEMLELPDHGPRELLLPINPWHPSTWTTGPLDLEAPPPPRQYDVYRAVHEKRPHLSVVDRWHYQGIETR